MAQFTEHDFRYRVRKLINDKLDEWFDIVPCEPDLCTEDLVLTEIQAALGWISDQIEKEEAQK